MAEQVLLPHFGGKSSRYSNTLYYFTVSIIRCNKDVYVNSFFAAQLESGILSLQNAFFWPII